MYIDKADTQWKILLSRYSNLFFQDNVPWAAQFLFPRPVHNIKSDVIWTFYWKLPLVGQQILIGADIKD